MQDFSLTAYKTYLSEILKTFGQVLPFDEYFRCRPESGFCIIRHDVDRKPANALRMARLESEIGVRSTYYFRDKPNSWVPEIAKQIKSLGHEVGYHYETLSDAGGDYKKALALFELSLERLRREVPVSTVSMHGRPFSPYDSRDIFRDAETRKVMFSRLNLLGEVYLDIDYSKIAYVSDTGRNWQSGASNLRDHVESNVDASFDSGHALLEGIKDGKFDQMIFQVHPERWCQNGFEWYLQALQDRFINYAKTIVRMIR